MNQDIQQCNSTTGGKGRVNLPQSAPHRTLRTEKEMIRFIFDPFGSIWLHFPLTPTQIRDCANLLVYVVISVALTSPYRALHTLGRDTSLTKLPWRARTDF